MKLNKISSWKNFESIESKISNSEICSWLLENGPITKRIKKNGAFKLAIDTQCSILPVTFKNNYDLFTDHKDFSGNSKPGLAKVIVHDSISTDNLTREDLVDLRDKTYEVIKTEIEYENRY